MAKIRFFNGYGANDLRDKISPFYDVSVRQYYDNYQLKYKVNYLTGELLDGSFTPNRPTYKVFGTFTYSPLYGETGTAKRYVAHDSSGKKMFTVTGFKMDVDDFMTLAANGEAEFVGAASGINLVAGPNDIAVFGMPGKDKLVGNDIDNTVAGYDGNDKMWGMGGVDTMYGFAGKDDMSGGSGDDVMYGGTEADKMKGDGGNDTLSGNDGNDTMSGSKGDDEIVGNAGRDILKGGSGADNFVYTGLTDSGTDKETRDRILDFKQAQGDRISLEAIDAIPATLEDDEFVFIGTDAFSGTAGELRFGTKGSKKKAKTLVEADADGDGIADFQIELKGHVELVAEDFIL